MTKFPEVISTAQRRRGRSTEDKVAILDAAFRKGGSVAAAADRFGVSRALIYIWRSRVRDGLMPGVAMTEAGISAFSAVALARETTPDVQSLPPPSPAPTVKSCRPVSCDKGRHGGTIEIRLTNGLTIRADVSIAPNAFARLVAALDTDARLRQDGGDA